MKGLGETSLFHRFTNPRREKSVYFWSWGSYLLCTSTYCVRPIFEEVLGSWPSVTGVLVVYKFVPWWINKYITILHLISYMFDCSWVWPQKSHKRHHQSKCNHFCFLFSLFVHISHTLCSEVCKSKACFDLYSLVDRYILSLFIQCI